MICANLSKIDHVVKALSNHPVRVIAVSKTKSVADILTAYECGIRDFGENYLQEAMLKITACRHKTITWHYLGRLQSKKLQTIAQHFNVIHSLDRLDHAQKLNSIGQSLGKAIKVFIQVNLDAEPQKSGVLLPDLLTFVLELANLDHLEVMGLMAIPQPSSASETLQKFQQLHRVSESLSGQIGTGLSMGMSQDYQFALQAGATDIRLGTAIFGPR